MTGSRHDAVGSIVVGAIVGADCHGWSRHSVGHDDAGRPVMYIFFVGLLAMPVVQMASIGPQITEALAGLDRIREIRRMATEDEEDAQREQLDTVAGEVVFDRVSFEYETDLPVLKGISFEAVAGSTTALVGSSGSGKSTLISLVMAFTDRSPDRVLVDGHDLAECGARLPGPAGRGPAGQFMFDGTVAENIDLPAA